MKKTLTINLNNIVFNIEEDAYDKLKKYLDSIREYFDSYQDNQEIFNDIEARAAEQFGGKIDKAKQVVTLEDVEELIKIMGTVEAIAGEEEAFLEHKAGEEKTKTGDKKLYRDPDNAIICGVASGIAAYFNIDPLLTRLAFAISVLFGGTGIVVYIILCFIMPEAKTTANKMEMRGEAVTLSSFKDAAMERVQIAKENIKGSGGARKTAIVFGKMLKYFVLGILIITGVSIVVSAIAALVALFFGFGTAIFNANSPYLNFPIKEVFPGATFYLAMAAAALVAIVPMIFLLILGLAMVRRKSSINLAGGLILLMIWVVALTACGSFAIKFAPQFEEKMQAFEQTEKSSRTFDLKNFSKIDADAAQDIVVTYGSEYKIEASGLNKDIEETSLSLDGDTLRIKKFSPWQLCIFCFTRRNPLTFKITMPHLDSFKARGFYKTVISGFSQKEITLDVDGVGETSFEAYAQNLFLKANGATRTTLLGSSTLMQININGVASLEALDFPSQEIQISANGASRASLWAIKKLDAKTNGAARVYYKGTPALTQETKGASRLEATQ